MGVQGRGADLAEQIQSWGLRDPGVPSGGDVEAPGVGGQPQRAAVEAVPGLGPGVPAGVVSSRIRAPDASAAWARASRSARRPSADCTADTQTSVVSAVTDSAKRSKGTSRTLTPRPACARNGKVTLVNSPGTVSTSLPSGKEAATRPTKTLTWLPTATVEGSTPTRAAYDDRAAFRGASWSGAFARPTRH